jgi:DNA-binding response OmpR family regulator
MNTYQQEVTQLRQKVEALEAELEVYRVNSDADELAAIMRGLRCTIGEAKLLRAFATGKTMTRERIAALCCHVEDGDLRLADSQVKRVRRKLPWLYIRTLYGIGYCVEGKALDLLRAKIGGWR